MKTNRFYYANSVEEFFEENEQEKGLSTNIMVKFDEEGYCLMVCYENGKVLKDYICLEEVMDCLKDMQKEEPNEKYEEGSALLCSVGWRLDGFRDNNYVADWLEE